MSEPGTGAAGGERGLSAEAARALAELAQAFLALEQVTFFYPEGHRAREGPLERCVRSLSALAAGRGEAVLALSDEELFWEGGFFRDLPPVVAKLAATLREQGITRLAWRSGIEPGELQGFMSRLVARRGTAPRRPWAEEEQAAHLRVEGVDYQGLLQEQEDGGEEQRRRDLWKVLLRRCLSEPGTELTPEEVLLVQGVWEDPETLAAVILDALGPAGVDGAPEATGPLRRMVGVLERGAGADAAANLCEGLREVGRRFPDALRFRLLESSLAEVSPGLFERAFGTLSPGDLVSLLAGNFALDADQLVRLTRVFQHLVPRQLERMELFPELRDQVAQTAPPEEALSEGAWEEVQELLSGEAGDFMSSSYREQLQRIARRQQRRREAEALLALLPELGPDLHPARWEEENARVQVECLRLATAEEPFRAALASVGTKARAALAAGEVARGTELLAPIVALLADGERGPLPRSPVGDALREIATPEVLEAILASFAELAAPQQAVLRELLGSAPEAAAARLLDALAAEADSTRRRHLMGLLGTLGHAALPEILRRIERLPPAAARAAVPLLGDLREAAAVPALLRVLRSGDALLRREALRALIRIDSPEARRALPALVEDRDEEIMQAAAAHLGSLGHRESRAELLRVLSRGTLGGLRSGEMRRAILALGRMRAAEAVAPLGELLRRRGWLSRQAREQLCAAAAQALRRIGTREARETLNRAVGGAPASLAAVYRGELARWEQE